MPRADEIVGVVRQLCATHAEEWGRLELEETGIGRLDHKIEKLRLIRHVLGVEAMRTEARTDANGTCVIEAAPWGVVGMALPATHSAPTMASNAINVLAAGNAAVFSPHPAAAQIAARALQAFNRGIEQVSGIPHLLCMVEKPSIESTTELFKHPDVALLCVTGGPGRGRRRDAHAASASSPPALAIRRSWWTRRRTSTTPPAASSSGRPSTTTCSASARRRCSWWRRWPPPSLLR